MLSRCLDSVSHTELSVYLRKVYLDQVKLKINWALVSQNDKQRCGYLECVCSLGSFDANVMLIIGHITETRCPAQTHTQLLSLAYDLFIASLFTFSVFHTYDCWAVGVTLMTLMTVKPERGLWLTIISVSDDAAICYTKDTWSGKASLGWHCLFQR